ncbi:MAG: DNA translocase FtsK [Epsilonproteobacteria bacterium]|nr:DNA translocase FtsK [Campylobacterota bacterium]
MVGSLGTTIGNGEIRLFGLFGYLLPLLLLYPFYRLYRIKTFREVPWTALSGGALLLFSVLIFQALVLKEPLRGWVGASIVDFLHPYIGEAGVWLFGLMTLALPVAMLWGETITRWFGRVSFKIPVAGTDAKGSAEVYGRQEPDEEAGEGPKPEKMGREEPQGREVFDEGDPVPEPEGEIRLIRRKKAQETVKPAAKSEKPASRKPQETTEHTVEIVKEIEENKKLLAEIDLGEQEKPKNFKLPKLDFLQKPPRRNREINEAEIDAKISDLLEKLSKFKIDGDVVRTYAGPVVTTFEFKPAAHIKVSKILNLQDDLAMALRAQTIRIQAPVPGKDVVGIEIPNKEIETIYLREILENDIFKKSKSPLTIALGKDIVGKPFVTDLKKLPHLLIAGTTGSGKSVGINAMILSLLYRNSPDQLKLMMIDPKMLEFSIYNDIPHLLTPVITQPKKAITALSNMVGEMERRYQLMSQTKTKNIETYNEKAKKEKREQLPYIVVVIDELADLMMTGGKDVEFSIARLAQMARASGIHLIVATQRPSVDVVTGLIKANLPSRISFKVGQKIDSKVILDTVGAESLLGRGDMLFTKGGGTLVRLHAPWSSEEEIETIVEYLKAQRPVEYDEHFLMEGDGEEEGASGSVDDIDPLFEEAKQVVLNDRKTSISYLQRKLQIGYNRAARIVEQLEAMGVVSAPDRKGNREILG